MNGFGFFENAEAPAAARNAGDATGIRDSRGVAPLFPF
jgi:hypothetical protein